MKWMFSFLIIMIVSGCSKRTTIELSNFNRTDFEEFVSLSNFEEIEIEELLDPVMFYLIHDSIIVVQNQLHCDYLIELYSLNNSQIIAQLASKGNGPGELTSCFCYIDSSTNHVFTIKDENAQTYYEINLDSTLVDKRLFIQKKFQYASEIRQGSEIYRTDDDHYVGYNMWYLDDLTYTNDEQALQIYSIDSANLQPYELSDYSYFVAPVNDVHLYVDSSNKNIWLFDGHKDKITIYNDSLRVRKIISGPDHLTPVYETPSSNVPMTFVNFPENKYYAAYLGYTVTEQHIYVIYQGINGGVYDIENLLPVEVFKFDKKGNPLICYQLDRYIYTISVDSQEKYLYATTRSSIGEPAQLIKYQLK